MMTLLCAVVGSAWAGENEVYNFAFTKQSGPSGYANTYTVTIGGKSWTIPGNLTNGDYLRIGGKSISEVDRVVQCNEQLPGNISKIVLNHNGKSRANVTVHSITVTVASDADFNNLVDEVTVSNPTVQKETAGSINFTPNTAWSGDLYYKFTVNISNSDSSNGGFDLTSLVFYEDVSGAVDPTVTFADASEEIEVGETVTNAITKPNDLTVTYSSSSPSVATVDNDGLVTGVAVGEATITASWEEVTDKYNAGSVSYTVTVTAATQAVNYIKVTNANQLVAGNEYIIVGTRAGKTAAMGARTGTNTYRNEVLVTETDNTVAVKDKDGVAILTLGGSTGAWTFLASDDNEYLALTSNSNALHSSTDATLASSQWTITDDFQVKDNSYSRYIQYNSGATRFACYTSGQGTSYLYVKEGSAINNGISQPVFNPEGGSYFETQNVTITCDADDATIYYTTDGTDPTDESTLYEGAIEVATTTTIKAIAYVGTDHSEIASATYTIVTPITIAAARAQETGDVYTQGVVTSCVGTTAYIQDETAAICVYGASLTVGDEIRVQGTLSTYNGLLEITNPTYTVVSHDNEVAPEVMTIEEVTTSTNQGWLVKIENATVSSINGNNVTITQGNNSILVRFNNTADITFAVNDIVTLTGNIGCYNTTQIANPTNVEVQGDKYYVAGTWTDWETNKIEMTKNSEGKYILTGQELAEGAEFKIIKVAGESSTWYGGQADGNQYWLTADNHTDIQLVNGANFYMSIAGTWTFTVDPTGNTPLLTVDGSWPEPDYFLVGSFNSWTTSDDYKLTKDETTGKYTISAAIAQGETFKIIDSDGTWYGAVSNGDFYVEANHVGTELSLASPGNNYYMDLSNTANWSIVFDPANMQLVLGNYVLPDPNASYVYQKVTSNEDLTSGKYLIVYEGGNVAFDGSRKASEDPKLDAAFNTTDVTITVFDKIYMKDAIYFNIDVEAGTIQSASGNYVGRTSNSNGLDASASASNAYTNTISIDDDGNAVIISSGGAYMRFNKSSNAAQFRYYKSGTYTGQQAIQLYKQVQEKPYTVTIQSQATDGTDYYATMADIGAGYFEVPEGVEVKTVNVINGKLNYPTTFTTGDVITGQGAYLVIAKAADSYTFPTVLEGTTTLPDNDLKSSGKGDLSATAMAAANDGNFKFYKLSLRNGKIGFYWGADDGAAFLYVAPRQAYLVVEQPETGNSELASAYYFDGDATGIYSVKTENEGTEDNSVYSLSGVRMDGKALPKGIYIVNGKKKVIK